MQTTIDYFQLEKDIISNRNNDSFINNCKNIVYKRIKVIDYIMDRFLEDFDDSDEKNKRFIEDHNQEYSKATRLMRIIDAYSTKH
jgi:ribosomal protein S17E